MGPQWFCKVLGQELGPVSFPDLAEMVRSGTLKEDDRVRRKGSRDWIPAREVIGLFHTAKAQPAQAPPAPGETEAASPPVETAEPAQPPAKPPRIAKRQVLLGIGLVVAMLLLVALVTAWRSATSERFRVPKYEYGEADPQPWVPEVAFENLDTDGDGQLDLAEYLADRRSPTAVQLATDIFRLSDLNGNGKLSLEEFKTKPPQATFRQIDLDGDGSLDLKEFYIGDMKTASTERVGRVFVSMDRDRDGKLSFEEYRVRPPPAWFHRMDGDEDGHLSLEEYTKANPGLVRSGHVERVFRVFDRNGDGRLDLPEYDRDYVENSFLFRDADGDGKLTFAEFNKWGATQEEFARRDADGDGRVSLQEFSAPLPATRFADRDADGDGRLSLDEYLSVFPEGEARRQKELFAILDADGDGALTTAEYDSRPPKATFWRMDLDGDGSLDPVEFHQGDMKMASTERAGRVFASMDRDGDGKLSFEEYRVRPPLAWFHRMDGDEDGYLSLEEYTKANPGLVRSGHVERVFRVLDRNGDGRLDLPEYVRDYVEYSFLFRDADGDGKLTFAEFNKWGATQEEFARRDADGDGRLSFKECYYDARDWHFWNWDGDGDGRVTAEELGFVSQGGAGNAAGSGRAGAKQQTYFTQGDANGDGMLTLDEYRFQPAEVRFRILDTNDDGGLSLEEFADAGAPPEEVLRAQEAFGAKDENADGKLTLEEFAAGEK